MGGENLEDCVIFTEPLKAGTLCRRRNTEGTTFQPLRENYSPAEVYTQSLGAIPEPFQVM